MFVGRDSVTGFFDGQRRHRGDLRNAALAIASQMRSILAWSKRAISSWAAMRRVNQVAELAGRK